MFNKGGGQFPSRHCALGVSSLAEGLGPFSQFRRNHESPTAEGLFSRFRVLLPVGAR